MISEINRYKQIIEDLHTKNDKLQEIIKQQNEEIKHLKKQNKLINQEVDKLINELALEEEEEDISPVADNEDDAEWIPLKGYEKDYTIYNCFPYPIKKISNKKIIKETINKESGYVQISLNGKSQQKHIIIAKQFIKNDDPKNKILVDHKDQNRINYNVTNLRWVTPEENNKNRTSTKGIVYEYVDSISDDAIVIDKYGEHEFENYYFYNNVFYFNNGNKFRKLYVSENKSGSKIVRLKDVDGKQTSITISKFKKQYNLD